MIRCLGTLRVGGEYEDNEYKQGNEPVKENRKEEGNYENMKERRKNLTTGNLIDSMRKL